MGDCQATWRAFAGLLFIHTLLWQTDSVLAQKKLLFPKDLIGVWQGSIVKDYEAWGAFITVVGGTGSSSEPVATLGIREELDWCMYTLPLQNITKSEGIGLRFESDSLWAHDNLSLCAEGSLRMKTDGMGRMIVDAEWDNGDISLGNTLIRLDDGSTSEVCNPGVKPIPKAASAGKESLDFAEKNDPSMLGIWKGVLKGEEENWDGLLTIVGGSTSGISRPVAVLALHTEGDSSSKSCVHILEMRGSGNDDKKIRTKTMFFWDRSHSSACNMDTTMFKFKLAGKGKISVKQKDKKFNVLWRGTLVRMDDGSTAETCNVVQALSQGRGG